MRELTRVIVVPGHGVCRLGATDPASAAKDESWVGAFPGEGAFLVEHIRRAVALAHESPDALLLFSGGQTRLAAGPRSEASSYLEIAREAAFWGAPEVALRTELEEYARDSLENLRFSLARYAQLVGRPPQRLAAVGWRFKCDRFELHARSLGFPSDRFTYVGVNDPVAFEAASAGEARKLEAFRSDPSLLGAAWQRQRIARDPFDRGQPYGLEELEW